MHNKKAAIHFAAVIFFLGFFILSRPVCILAESLTKEEIYRQMSDHFLKRETVFRVETEYNESAAYVESQLNSDRDDVYYSILFDMAETVDDEDTTDDSDYLYGLLGSVYCEYWNGSLLFYDVEYYESLKETKKVNAYIKKMAAEIEKEKKSVYGRIKLSHDRIISMIKYDTKKNCLYSAYGGLYKGRTVCNGYALIMYKLLNEMGIPCKFVTGYTDGCIGNLHAWNIVKIKNKWYNVDVTWDDGDDGIPYRDYFLKSDKSMSADHTKDFFYLTKEFKEKYPMSKKDYRQRAA